MHNHKFEKNDAFWALGISITIIIWWASIWGLFEDFVETITGNRHNIRRLIYITFLVLIFFTLYEFPFILEQF